MVKRCATRPLTHEAAATGASRPCAFKAVNRWRRYGEAGLRDRSVSTPIRVTAPDKSSPDGTLDSVAFPRCTPLTRNTGCDQRRCVGPCSEEKPSPGCTPCPISSSTQGRGRLCAATGACRSECPGRAVLRGPVLCSPDGRTTCHTSERLLRSPRREPFGARLDANRP
ncbi:leucine zipper domain-containing protein [Streptomyces sp. NPDC052299]|uniref:leucine zipper domain-containing protein n=1 Tax=Streptomyces sp. NPDC052299 TaxID=3155054 RepID=UPI00343112A8